VNGKVIHHVPSSQEALNSAEPVYEDMEGWKTEVKDIETFSDLPVSAQRYVRRIEELTGTKVTMISVGSERNETLGVKNPFPRSKTKQQRRA
jgi:adenylosuccinate synthase